MHLTNILRSKSVEFAKQLTNFPEKYIKRSRQRVFWENPTGKPNYLPKVIEKKRYRYTTNRSWSGHFHQQNMPGTIRKKVFVTPLNELCYYRGDRVELLAGKDKGKQGIISQIIPERNWVIVDGLNCHYRKVAGDKDYPGVIIKSEAPLLMDEHVCLVDPSDLKATEFEMRFTEEGEKVRVSKRTGRIIPIPKINEQTHDYKTKGTYLEREKDTTADVVSRISFSPSLQTFEMDILKHLGIHENNTPKKTYWY